MDEKINIDEKNKKVVIKFDTVFYPSGCVFKAVQDFSDSCWTSADGTLENLQVVLKPKSKNTSLDTLGYEFYNYVLSIIKNKNKVQSIEKRLK